jgi:hypothetical protein
LKTNLEFDRPLKRIILLILLTVLVACLGLFVAVEVVPHLGARIAGQMRAVLGPQPVARLEEFVFQIQDRITFWQYQSGIEQARAPWESDPTPAPSQITTATETLIPTATATPGPENHTQGEEGRPSPTVAGPTPTPTAWGLPDLEPFGEMDGEGVWQPYLHDRDGRPVAVRTFLQPDPERPYAIVAVVAFDLTRTQLHFVLGFNEPSLPGGPTGDGLIAEEHRRAGLLLAAFNGGFRAANGNFGAMANGIVALPPKDGFATVAIYQDGDVRIGNWGEEITASPELVAWRQNCRLILQDGEISERVYNDSITDWGASISNEIVTRRSALGLDHDAETLYYFAGPSLSMPVLADAMQTAGVADGMLLDINHFWVHFTAIESQDGELVAVPLLPDDMFDQVDRYLKASPADFFYVTLLDER